MAYGQIDPLGEFHERQGTPRFGRAGADLGQRRAQFRQEIGGHLITFDVFGDATEEPGLEGVGRIRHTRRHAIGCRAVAGSCSVSVSVACCGAVSLRNRRPLRATRWDSATRDVKEGREQTSGRRMRQWTILRGL